MPAHIHDCALKLPVPHTEVVAFSPTFGWFSAFYYGPVTGWYYAGDVYDSGFSHRRLVPDVLYWMDKPSADFHEFSSIGRLRRQAVITEKIDGSNTQIVIGIDGSVRTGTRTKWVTISDDFHGFAKWVRDHQDEIVAVLGKGRHFGEFWGQGIGQKYNQDRKRFSLFNTRLWCPHGTQPAVIKKEPDGSEKYQTPVPEFMDVVPVLYDGIFSEAAIEAAVERLRSEGSVAAPGFMKPEGVVVYHTATSTYFKRTLEHDDIPKSLIPVEVLP